MGEVISRADAQYNDYVGTVAVDGHGHGDLVGMAWEKGVPQSFHPVAFGVSGVLGRSVTVYAVDKGRWGGDDWLARALEATVRKGHPLPVQRFQIEVNFQEMGKYIKRLSVLCKSQEIEDAALEVVEGHD